MTEPLPPRLEIWRGLLFGQRAMLLRLSADTKERHGLTTAQYEALLTLLDAPGHTLSASDLADALLYSSGSASNLVKRMESLGWVRRREGADRRVVLVELTPEGRRLIEAATRDHVAALEKSFAPLVEEDEVEGLLRFARRLAAHEGVSSQRPGAPS